MVLWDSEKSSKFDVNRIMLLTVDGTPAMFATIKERYFSVSRITVCIYKLPLLDTSVRSVLELLLILSGRTPLFTTGSTRCFWQKPMLGAIICSFIKPCGGLTNTGGYSYTTKLILNSTKY
jgi:hypothetical protein